MSSDNNGDKGRSICYVKFKGNGVDFNKWKVKTLVALARRKKFDLYLREDGARSTYSEVRLNYDQGNMQMRGIN